MRISPVTRDDFADWLAMRQELYTGLDDVFHHREMEFIFVSEHLACFLARSDQGEAMGMLELSLRNLVDGCIGGPVGYIEGIYLKPKSRGQGHGAGLIEFAESWFKSRGCQDMATDTELENTGVQEFFRRSGFEETYRIVEFKKPLVD